MKRLFLILLMGFLLITPVSAQTAEDTYNEIYAESGLDGVYENLDDEVKDTLEDLGFTLENYELQSKADNKTLLNFLKEVFLSGITAPISGLTSATALVLICALFGGLFKNESELKVSHSYLCAMGVSAVVLFPLMDSISDALNTIEGVGSFMLSFIPVFCGILIFSGNISTAALYQGTLLGICEAITSASSFIIAPFISLYVCLGMSAAVSENEGVYKIATSIKTVANWILGLLMSVFTGFLGLQSVITKSADTLKIKTGKFFIGSFVPVVGGALSEALTTVTAGISMLKASSAIWGAVAVAVMLLPIVIELLLWKLTLSILSSVSEMFSLAAAKKMFSVLAVSIGFLLGLIILIGVMLILSIVVISSGG